MLITCKGHNNLHCKQYECMNFSYTFLNEKKKKKLLIAFYEKCVNNTYAFEISIQKKTHQ